jgi:hypothetical protein
MLPIEDLRFGVGRLGYGVWDLGFGVLGLEVGVWCLGSGVRVLGVGSGLGLWSEGSGGGC